MVKARKTRQQKELADMRRFTTTPSGSYSIVDQPTPSTPSPKIHSTVINTTSEYGYVRHDLLHTLLITGIIVALQVVLVFVLN